MRYLVVLALVGCASRSSGGWEKQNASQDDFAADRGQCVAQAFAAPTVYQQQMIFAGCMQGKGWYWRER